MQFVFKRDDEGRERIYVGDVCVAQGVEDRPAWEHVYVVYVVDGVDRKSVDDAIERADEAGFWEHYAEVAVHGCDAKWTLPKEVTVDVPVAETSTTLTLVREDD